jgi:hypothetical protein
MPQDEDDQIISIPHQDVDDVTTSSGLILNAIKIHFGDDSKIKIAVNRGHGKNIEEDVSEYILKRKDVLLKKIGSPEKGEVQTSQHSISNSSEPDVELICRKCKNEIAKNTEKCPHCGFYPEGKKKGALWNATGFITAPLGIGTAMLTKSAADKVRGEKPVGEEVLADSNKSERSSISGEEVGETDILGKIEKLSELKKDGIITEKQFEDKKEDLLDRV